MKIAIGADHGGFVLKKGIMKFLEKNGYKVKDFGTFSSRRCDYPSIGYKVARELSKGNSDRGILICKSGLGMTMVSNKVPGVRAALLHDKESARSSREHNDANIAVFSGSSMGLRKANEILKVWLKTEFAGGRHARRVSQIQRIEEKIRRLR